MNSDPSKFPHPLPYFVQSDYGFVHVYALMMVLGILFSILGSYVLAKNKKLPADPFIFSIIFIIPAALFFASFFGKTRFDEPHWFSFANFAFWSKSGGMSIHGGLLGGIIVGLIFFKITTKKYHISIWLYADCILPNVLLGQVIGRWGNFFNHELLGNKTTYHALSWLPDFICNNCIRLNGGSHGTPELNSNGYMGLQFRQPIAVYESFLDLCAWVLIVLIIPKINYWFNHKIKHDYLNYQQFTFKKYCHFYYHNFKYYACKILRIFSKNDKFKLKKVAKNWTTSKKLYENYYYQKKIWVYSQKEFKQKNLHQKKITLQKRKIFQIKKFKFNIFFFKINTYSAYLTKEHNPKHYFIWKCGVASGLYFMFWNYIRFLLETERESDILFLPYLRTIDYIVILALGTMGLLLAIYNQFINPSFFRKKGKIYEKQY